jgi:hypothetical protein
MEQKNDWYSEFKKLIDNKDSYHDIEFKAAWMLAQRKTGICEECKHIDRFKLSVYGGRV